MPAPYEEDPAVDAKVWEYRHLSHCFARGHRFDLIHNQADFPAHAFAPLVDTPMVTTIHGFSSNRILPMYAPFSTSGCITSRSARPTGHPALRYAATIHHGIRVEDFPFDPDGAETLLFFGRIHPDKGAREAVAAARASGRRLDLYGLVQDEEYARDALPADDPPIRYHGVIGGEQRLRALGQAQALLHLINFDEPVRPVGGRGDGLRHARHRQPARLDARTDRRRHHRLPGGHARRGGPPRSSAPAISTGPAIRRHVAARFSVERMADDYIALYRRILGR